ncbi:MAG: hypothetical protein HYV39_02295 [Candidatus Levybacteria bacterium]|nr:hypothetical protein [Candidatus Levybacteria bacterium]
MSTPDLIAIEKVLAESLRGGGGSVAVQAIAILLKALDELARQAQLIKEELQSAKAAASQ